jgi:hypothetical protein
MTRTERSPAVTLRLAAGVMLEDANPFTSVIEKTLRAVASWLGEEADRADGLNGYECSDAYPLMLDGFRNALSVARAYLGES